MDKLKKNNVLSTAKQSAHVCIIIIYFKFTTLEGNHVKGLISLGLPLRYYIQN